MTSLTPAEAEVLSEIRNATDRVAGILAASYVEESLHFALCKALRDDVSEQEKFIGKFGVLSGHMNKVRLAYLLNIIDDNVVEDLKVIAGIRNEFAHQFAPASFDSQSIANRCRNLKLIDLLSAQEGAPDVVDPFSRPQSKGMTYTGIELADGSFEHRVRFISDDRDEKINQPRWRYEMTCYILSSMLRHFKVERPPSRVFVAALLNSMG